MKHRIGSFGEIRPKAVAVIRDAVDFYQSSCWHCKALWVPGLDVKDTDRGKIYPVCGQLNETHSAP
jgi:hypothetical protein